MTVTIMVTVTTEATSEVGEKEKGKRRKSKREIYKRRGFL
jgi:hypothetical protein